MQIQPTTKAAYIRQDFAGRAFRPVSEIMVLRLCLIGVFIQTFIGYLCLHQSASRQFDDDTLLYRATASLVIFLGVGYAVFTWRGSLIASLPRGWVKVARGAAITAIVGMLVAVVRENSWRYIATDLFRYSTAWLTLLFGIAAAVRIARSGRSAVLLQMVDWLALLALIDAVATLLIHLSFPWYKVSTMLYFYGIGWGLFQKRWPRSMGILLLAISLGAALISGKRGVIIALGACTPVLVWYQFRDLKQLLLNTSYALLLVILGGILLQQINGSESNLLESFEERSQGLLDNVYEIVFQGKDDASMEGRFAEASNVFAFFREQPHLLLCGGGFGTEVEMYEHTGVYSSSGRMHQVHMGWLAYLLRNGLLGVGLLVLFCWVTVSTVRRRGSGVLDSAIPICGMYAAMQIVLSVKSQIMLEFVSLPIVVALVAGIAEANRQSNPTSSLHGFSDRSATK